jgi:hypothetical protein
MIDKSSIIESYSNYSKQLNTPILFLIYKRLDTTKQVFEVIKKIKPTRLYIAADGPKEDIAEKEKVKKVRDYVLSNINWNCELKTLFREKNLGSGIAVSEAITWFFENEEMGIILEDDCLPSQSFFWFCDELLKKYINEEKIMQINGSSYLSNIKIKESYFFSKYNHIWGWATWRRAWKHFNLNYSNWEELFESIKYFHSKKEKEFWKETFKNYFPGKIDIWDQPWTFSVWINNGLCIYPKLNMIRNIGFDGEGTHCHYDDFGFSKMPLYDFNLDEKNMIHPKKIELNLKLDLENFNKIFKPLSLYERVINKLRNKLNLNKKEN